MPNKQQHQSGSEPQRIKITARLTLTAYDAITEVQRRHITQTGRVLPLWKVLNAAVIAYAKEQGIKGRK